MRNLTPVFLTLCLIALGVWAAYFLPGWLGLAVVAGMFLAAIVATILWMVGVGGRQKVWQRWKDFFDALSGL